MSFLGKPDQPAVPIFVAHACHKPTCPGLIVTYVARACLLSQPQDQVPCLHVHGAEFQKPSFLKSYNTPTGILVSSNINSPHLQGQNDGLQRGQN